MKKIPMTITALIAALLSIQPGFGAEVNLRTRFGFNGYAVPGTLMPMSVEINRTIVNGRLEIVSPGESGSYSIIDSFPIHNSKRIETSVFVNENINDLRIRLISGKQVLLNTKLNSKVKLFPGNLILAIKVTASAQQFIERALLPIEPVLVVPTQVTDLPGVALNYDGISGLVLSDPGSVLKPLQVQALKVWLTGGGRMVLGSVRSGNDSLLSMLAIDPEKSEQSFYPIGFGGITVLPSGFNDSKQNDFNWQGILNLKPYTETSRLMINRLFPDFKANSSSDSSELSSKAASYLALVLILWVISGLIITILTKHNRILFLIGASLLWTVAAFPIGNWLAGVWHRGAEIHTRHIILPKAGCVLTDVKVRFNRSMSGKTINFKSSPWGGKVSIGEVSYGTVKTKSKSKNFTWSHRLNQAKTIVKSAGPGWVCISGWFPLETYYKGIFNEVDFARNLGNDSDTVIWDGKHFYRSWAFQAASSSDEITQIPYWLCEEHEWLNKLHRFSPETVWLIGYGHLSDIIIKFENSVYSGELWALPLPEGVRK